MAFRFGFNGLASIAYFNSLRQARFCAQAAAEDDKLRKELFGGPCFEGTLQNNCLTRRWAEIRGLRMKSRGRDN
jgi:hypothetical protein